MGYTKKKNADDQFVIAIFDAETNQQVIGGTVDGDSVCLSCLYQEFDLVPRDRNFEDFLAEADPHGFRLIYREAERGDDECTRCQQELGKVAPAVRLLTKEEEDAE